MIFHDESNRRKFAVRIIAVFAALWLLTLSSDIVLALTNSGAIRTPFSAGEASDRYRYYYQGAHEKEIALTFDDGPHPEYTREIANILSRENVRATFFFIGKNALAYPDVVEEVAAQGFQIENHSFSHSWDVHDSKERLARELNSTSFVIHRITGKETKYYRPPFLLAIGIDPAPNPYTPTSTPNTWALELGYMPVGIDIDSGDWDAKSTEEILWNISGEWRNRHIVLFHDRKITVEALPAVLAHFKEQGYRFVTLDEMLTPTSTASAGGTAALPHSAAERLVERDFIFALAAGQNAFVFLIEVALGFMAVRLLLFLGLAFLTRKKTRTRPYAGLVSIVIPAWNEEENIRSTMESVIASRGVDIEVIVVDDGSDDRTGLIARETAARHPDRAIQVIPVGNGGKGRALNVGLLHAAGEAVVALDADVVLEPDAIRRLVAHLSDPEVGAVAGKVYTARLDTLLQRMQALEYLVGQNIEKSLLSRVNGVNVVPGALGAWRKSILVSAGGFSSDTLAEDQDMTLSVLGRGYRVAYEPNAVAYTETPPTVKEFLKQRFRWVYGAMQCFWKHRAAAFDAPQRGLGLFAAIPNMAIFHMLFPLLYPLIDLALLYAVVTGSWWVATPALLFTLFDLAYAYVGLRGERYQWRILAIVPLARLIYRQLIFYAILKSVVLAFEGGRFGWNKVAKYGEADRLYKELLQERAATPS